MDKDFANPIEQLERIRNEPRYAFYHQQLIDYVNNLDMYNIHRVLDIGERNPLTRKMEAYFDIPIDNTKGDLDETLTIVDHKGDVVINKLYEIIIFNHVIEHIFNPLFCLENIKKVMHKGSNLVVGTPIKPNFLTSVKSHFHEMDKYRFRKLLDRAGLEITDWKQCYTYRPIRLVTFTGIRPFIGMFYKRNTFVTCRKK